MKKMNVGCLACAVVAALGLPGAARAQLVISEVLFDPIGVNTGRQVVEIRNIGDAEVNMQSAGYWLFFPPARWQFPPGVSIGPGDTVQVLINHSGVNTEDSFYTGISGMRNLRGQGPQGDSLALFTTNLFGDPTKIIDFVQWGAAGNGGEDVAAAAGIWAAGQFVDIASLREGASIVYDGTGNTPGDWCIDGTPTLGSPNDSCTTAYVQSALRLNEVGYLRMGGGKYHPAIEIKNSGDVLEDLGGKWVVLGGQHSYQFPLGTTDTLLGPEEIAVVHLGVTATDGPGVFYTGAGTFRELNPVDAVSLHAVAAFQDATGVIDFVQWGAAGSSIEPAAVTAGFWNAGEFVDASDRRPRGSVAARGSQRGMAAWVIDNTATIGVPNDAPPFVPVVINEVVVDPQGPNAQRGQVELRNVLSDEAISLAGGKLCFESTTNPGTTRCFSFAASASIPAGGYVLVHVNRAGISNAGNIFTGPLQDMHAAKGVAFLLISARENDANNFLDYLAWGTGPGYGENLAVQAGIWTALATVDTSDIRDGSSIAYDGEGDAATDYRVDTTPTPGLSNSEIARNDPFRRGDCNDSGKVDISDAIGLLSFLFAGGAPSLCRNACDTNDDEVLDISDPVYLLNHLFGGGLDPPDPGPGPNCGTDPDGLGAGHLDCSSYLKC